MQSGMRGFARLGGGACVWPSPRPTPLSLRRRPRSPRSSPRTRAGLGSVNAAARRWGATGDFSAGTRSACSPSKLTGSPEGPGCAEGPPVTAAWLLLQPETLPSPGQTLRLPQVPEGTECGRRGLSASRGRCGTRLLPSPASLREQGRPPVKCQARLVAAAVY